MNTFLKVIGYLCLIIVLGGLLIGSFIGLAWIETQRNDILYIGNNETIEWGDDVLYNVRFWGVMPENRIIKLREYLDLDTSDLLVFPIEEDNSFTFERFGTEKLILTNIRIINEKTIICDIEKRFGKYARE